MAYLQEEYMYEKFQAAVMSTVVDEKTDSKK